MGGCVAGAEALNRASRALVCGCGAFCAAIAVGAPAFALEVPNADVEVASQVDPAVPTGWTTNAWGDFADGATFAWKDGGYNSTMCLRVQTTAPAKASGQGDAKWRSAPINVKGVGAVKVGVDAAMGDRDVFILDTSRIFVRPLNHNGVNRAFFREPVKDGDDSFKGQVIGEYTLEVRAGSLAHGKLYGLGDPTA